jgi:voltage-gated potassium channel
MRIFNETAILEKYTWWCSVTITTVGYGDYAPETTYGRLSAGVIMFFGIGAIGLVIGKLAEIIIYTANKRIKGLGYMNYINHTLLMGYRKGSTEKIINELLENNSEEKIVLCSYDQESNPVMRESIEFIKGELASEDVLDRSNAALANNIIIHGLDDNQTFFTAYAFRAVNTSAHMVCYLRNEDHLNKIANLAADDKSLNQVILPADVYLMAQELQDRGSSGVVQQLISNLTGENLYRYDIPNDCEFKSNYKNIFFAMKMEYGATVLAVKNDDLIINPDLLLKIESGMAIYYAAPARLSNICLRVLGTTYE